MAFVFDSSLSIEERLALKGVKCQLKLTVLNLTVTSFARVTTPRLWDEFPNIFRFQNAHQRFGTYLRQGIVNFL
jgi:hypothetical protein